MCRRSLRTSWFVLVGLVLATPFARAVDLTEAELARLTPRQRERLIEVGLLDEKLAKVYAQGKLPEALLLARQVATGLQEVLGANHPLTAQAMSQWGFGLVESGDYAAARPLLEKALQVQKQTLGLKHEETAETLNSLGLLHFNQGNYASAQSHFEQAWTIRRQKLGDKHEDTAIVVNNLGLVQLKMGDFVRSKSSFETALAALKQAVGEKHKDTALTLSNLALAHEGLGDFLAARTCCEKALAIRREVLGERHPDTAASLHNLGLIYHSLGDLPAAKQHLERALAIYQASVGEKHADVGHILNSLGSYHQDQADFATARKYFERALAIQKQVQGDKHLDLVQTLSNLGTLFHHTADAAGARAYFESALAIVQGTPGGEKHVEIVLPLLGLGGLSAEAGDFATARNHLERVQRVMHKSVGADNFDAAVVLGLLASVAAGAQDWSRAAQLMDQARRQVRREAVRILPGLSEREILTCLRSNDEEFWHTALSLGLDRRDAPEFCALSAAWLLNGKGVAQEALAQQTLLGREARDPATAAGVNELQSLRRQMAALHMAAPQPGQETVHREQIQRLTGQEQELSRRLFPHKRDLDREPWIELEAVRKGVPARGLFVDFACFRPRNFQARSSAEQWRPERYVAWLLPPADGGPVAIVDLGEAATIDAAIREARQAVQNAAATLADRGETEAESLARAALEKLSRLVLLPIREQLAEVEHLILSPDASLWLAPWGAMSLRDDRYLVEDVSLRLVVSGRDLVTEPVASAASRNPPIVMADPDFDLKPAELQAATQAVLRSTYRAPTAQELLLRSLTKSSVLPKVLRLPGTAAEAQLILPKLESLAGGRPLVYVGSYALEGVFRKIAQPKVLVLSTHGFFLSDQEVQATHRQPGSTRGAALSTSGKSLENPFLRCGLLLAGCNRRESNEQVDDGILTGLEILGVDLRGTELVVLSACETAVGDVRNGDGVAGLRQAFQLAGAKSVVATLWQIPDRESVLIMNDFFANLAEGQSKPVALRRAQLKRIEARRDKYGAAHPFFWAAWTVTGN